MLSFGTQRLGEEVSAYHLGKRIRARVVATPFVDPQGERLRG
jgi:glycine cleavage system aminomethyltransferase T